MQRLNGRRVYPPIQLRREVGPLASFDTSAVATLERMRFTAGLTPTSRFFDMGCGCGAVPLALNEFGSFGGEYLGLDVMRPLVGWCEKHLANERTRFVHFDYWSGTYNPEGTRFLRFPVDDGWADVILMKSVFTHMLPEDVAHYLRETARVLALSGTAVLTAKLYEEETPLICAGWPNVGAEGSYRFLRRDSPESSVAYSREWMDSAMADAGLVYEYDDGVAQGRMTTRLAPA